MRSRRYLISEMDQNVKQMLKLIEEDGDSFAKKAEMYYKKRPELINLVDEFYRMYRSLAERYEYVSGECRKSVPSDVQSQGSSSCVSEICSESPSTCPSPPDNRCLITRRTSGLHRAAGFDFFNVAISNHSELSAKDVDESSTLDSEYESDDSSVINYVPAHATRSNEDHGLRRRIGELELEIRHVHEKHWLLQEEIFKGEGQVEELKVVKKKIRPYGEINRLKDELQNYTSFNLNGKDFDHLETSSKEEVPRLQISPEEDPVSQIHCLEEKNKHIEDLNNSLDEFKLRYETLLAEKNELDDRVTTYVAELEENREAIRQLCFSLEHYRNGYHMLRKSVIGHNHPTE